MFDYAHLKIYKRVLLALKVGTAVAGLTLSVLVCILLLKDFEHNTLLKVAYVTAIYTAMISGEKTLKLLHRFIKRKRHD